MDVRNCRMCGKLYNFIGGPYRNLCPNCIEKMGEKFVYISYASHSNKGLENFDLTTLIKKEIYSRLGKKIAVANYCNSYIFIH